MADIIHPLELLKARKRQQGKPSITTPSRPPDDVLQAVRRGAIDLPKILAMLRKGQVFRDAQAANDLAAAYMGGSIALVAFTMLTLPLLAVAFGWLSLIHAGVGLAAAALCNWASRKTMSKRTRFLNESVANLNLVQCWNRTQFVQGVPK